MVVVYVSHMQVKSLTMDLWLKKAIGTGPM